MLKLINTRTKAIIYASILILFLSIGLGVILSLQSRQTMMALVNHRMLDLVKTAADMIDGDALETVTIADRGTEKYDRILATLSHFEKNTGLEFIYAIRQTKDGSFMLIVNPDEEDIGWYGKQIQDTEALHKAGEGIAGVDTEPYSDDFGNYYSAYAPVFNSAGKVTGVITADFDSGWYEEQINRIFWTISAACLLFVIIGIAVEFMVIRVYKRSLISISDDLGGLAEDMNALTLELSGEEKDSAASAGEMLGENADMAMLGECIASLRGKLRNYITHSKTRENSMITAMASDYRSVYHVDLDKNEGVCYRADPDDPEQTPPGVPFPYLERFTWYADNVVTDMYREGFLQFIDPGNIRAGLEEKPIMAFRYLARRGGREYYEMIRVAGVRRAAERADHIVHAVGLGLTVIDEEMRESMARNHALAEALNLAEEANHAKTAFLSNMSHEIRTPMNAIIGLNNMALKDETLTDTTRDYLAKTGASARHLLALINDILDMTRIESGRLTLNQEEFSFGTMLEQINTMVMSQCSDKGLTYECRLLSPVDEYYVGDDMKLKEVLINILSNAIKFTDAPGSVTFTVERIAVFEDQTTMKFVVADTGIGMDKEYIPKIFDSFSQEDSSRKNKYGSTGLGMAITKSIVEMMNGSIFVESEKGVGSTFSVLVSLKNSTKKGVVTENSMESGSPQSLPAHGEEEAAKDTAESLAGRHILLAEDIEINAEIMMDILEMEDMTADHAENGRIAVQLFAEGKEGTYDAVLMDVRMPEMDGLEAAATIRRMDRPDAKTIPIIALTANAFDEDVQRSLQAGMNAHLSKPVEPEHLYQTLKELIFEEKNKEPITSGTAKQDGNEIEHPTDFVRYKHTFIEEE